MQLFSAYSANKTTFQSLLALFDYNLQQKTAAQEDSVEKCIINADLLFRQNFECNAICDLFEQIHCQLLLIVSNRLERNWFPVVDLNQT